MRSLRPVRLLHAAQPRKHGLFTPQKRVGDRVFIRAGGRDILPPAAAGQDQPPHRRSGRMFRVRRVCVIIAGTQDGQRVHGAVLRQNRAAVFKGQNVIRPCQQLPILPKRLQRPLPCGGVAEAGLYVCVQRLLEF